MISSSTNISTLLGRDESPQYNPCLEDIDDDNWGISEPPRKASERVKYRYEVERTRPHRSRSINGKTLKSHQIKSSVPHADARDSRTRERASSPRSESTPTQAPRGQDFSGLFVESVVASVDVAATSVTPGEGGGYGIAQAVDDVQRSGVTDTARAGIDDERGGSTTVHNEEHFSPLRGPTSATMSRESETVIDDEREKSPRIEVASVMQEASQRYRVSSDLSPKDSLVGCDSGSTYNTQVLDAAVGDEASLEVSPSSHGSSAGKMATVAKVGQDMEQDSERPTSTSAEYGAQRQNRLGRSSAPCSFENSAAFDRVLSSTAKSAAGPSADETADSEGLTRMGSGLTPLSPTATATRSLPYTAPNSARVPPVADRPGLMLAKLTEQSLTTGTTVGINSEKSLPSTSLDNQTDSPTNRCFALPRTGLKESTAKEVSTLTAKSVPSFPSSSTGLGTKTPADRSSVNPHAVDEYPAPSAIKHSPAQTVTKGLTDRENQYQEKPKNSEDRREERTLTSKKDGAQRSNSTARQHDERNVGVEENLECTQSLGGHSDDDRRGLGEMHGGRRDSAGENFGEEADISGEEQFGGGGSSRSGSITGRDRGAVDNIGDDDDDGYF